MLGLRRPAHFDDPYEANSADYTVDKHNSYPRDNFLNEGNVINGLSAINPLSAIDGARNPNDSAENVRDRDNRQSLSAAVNLHNEVKEQPSSVVTARQAWNQQQNRNAKPPLFRH